MTALLVLAGCGYDECSPPPCPMRDEITHPDTGDAARLHNGEAKRLTASVNLGEHVVTITEGN